MALNNSPSPISLGGSTTGQSVNLELGQSATATISFNDAAVRTLTGTTAGTALSMPGGFWGKSSSISLTINSNQTNLNLRVWALFNGWDGVSFAEITVAAGVYIYSTNTSTAGLTIDGSWPGGVSLINNGFIMGKGGKGGLISVGGAGGTAISLGTNVSITNNNYIGGGGGGGGGADVSGGGGGAGGGDAGNGSTTTGGVGGAPGSAGTNGG